MINTFSMAKAIEESLALGEKGILSAKIVLTGFVVVFSVLIILITFIVIYGKIVTSAETMAENKKKKAETKAQEAKPVASVAVKKAPAIQSNGVSDEIVAVISAAVATMYGSTEKVKIKSIKKSNGGRSAWANAGVINNTRPF